MLLDLVLNFPCLVIDSKITGGHVIENLDPAERRRQKVREKYASLTKKQAKAIGGEPCKSKGKLSS